MRRSWGNKLGRAAAGAALSYVGLRLFSRAREQDLRGKVVLVTGGSRGLGLALAREFAREGCRLVLCGRDILALDRARNDLLRLGAEVHIERCDVSDRHQAEMLVAHAVRCFGRIDVVVNNAGLVQVGPFESMTPMDFKEAMNVNFWGPLYVTWAALPFMREQGGGQLVNVTSIGGKIAVPHLLPYDAAKSAFVGLSEGLQAELRQDGIAVTTVVPGLMRTGSPVNAVFKGDAVKEFEWFSVSDSLLVTSTSAKRAARRIVRATKRREGEVVISWQAKLLRLVHGLAPNVTIAALGLVNRLLPRSDENDSIPGARGRDLFVNGYLKRLLRNMRTAASELNQIPGLPAPNGRSRLAPS